MGILRDCLMGTGRGDGTKQRWWLHNIARALSAREPHTELQAPSSPSKHYSTAPSDDDGCGTLSERPDTAQSAQEDQLPEPHQCNALPAFLLTPSAAHCWAPTSPEPSVSPAETLVFSRTHYQNRRDGPWMWGAWEGAWQDKTRALYPAGGRAWWSLVLFMSSESILSLDQSVSSVAQSSGSVTPWTVACQASLSITNSQSPPTRWCHPTISSSVIPFSSCLQSFPASGSFPMSLFFTSSVPSTGVSASASVLPMNTQDWFPLGWTGWVSLQSKQLSRVFSNTTVQKHQFFGAQLSL